MPSNGLLILNTSVVKSPKVLVLSLKHVRFFSAVTLLSLYNSLIMPYLSYCIHVWGKAYDTHLRHLMSLQNKVVRIIAGVPPRTHVEYLYAAINTMPLKKMYLYTVGSCINSKMICSKKCLLICLLMWALYMIEIQDNLQGIIYMYHCIQQAAAKSVSATLGPALGTSFSQKSTHMIR